MPRPRGSRNKRAGSAAVESEYTAQIAELEQELKQNGNEIEALSAQLLELKKDLLDRKAESKKLNRKLNQLIQKRNDAEAAAAEQARRSEAGKLLEAMLADGRSADEIISMLKPQ